MNLSENLARLTLEQSERTIYRVHNPLRNVNNKAFDPVVISIGPYHHGHKNLRMLEEQKLIYLHSLLRSKKENLERYVSAIEPLEEKARKCYSENISMTPAEFIDMLVLDGCFIIQLVRKFSMLDSVDENDPIFHMDWMMYILKRDLMLFENQIPFFILHKLFNLIEVPHQKNNLMQLFFSFFEKLYPGKAHKNDYSKTANDIKHLLDFVHSNWRPSSHLSDRDTEIYESRSIGRAKELKEANVRFVRDDKAGLFDVGFQDGILTLAPLRIEDNTECLLRNMIAYEQYFTSRERSFVTCYVTLLGHLIDSSKDVDIFLDSKIISNWLGESVVVANMISKLTVWVGGLDESFIYPTVFGRINKHCTKRSNRYRAALRHNYLNTPWTILSIIAALMILLLTFFQTVCSILEVLPKIG